MYIYVHTYSDVEHSVCHEPEPVSVLINIYIYICVCVCMCSMWVLPISGRQCSYSLETRQSAQTSARTQSVVVDTFSCQTILMKINLKEKALQTKLKSLRKINLV